MEKDRYFKRKDGTMEFVLESWMNNYMAEDKKSQYVPCDKTDYEKHNLPHPIMRGC